MNILLIISTKFKARILCLCFILFGLKVSSKIIHFTNCEDSKPLEDLMVFSKEGTYIGNTDSEGKIDVNNTESIFVSGLNVSDTIIHLNKQTEFCLVPITHQLLEFNVVEKKTNPMEVYVKLLKNSLVNMHKGDTSVYYDFSHKVILPDSGWSETLVGIIRLDINMLSKKRAFARLYMCNVKRKGDSQFVKSTAYQNPINSLGLFSLINQNFMFSNYNKIDKRFKENVEILFYRKNADTTVFEINLNRNLDNEIIESKENVYFVNDVFNKSIIVSNTKANNLLNNFYGELYFTNTTPVYIKSMYQKIIRRWGGIHFIHEFNVVLSQEKPKECMDKLIIPQKNYETWLNSK